MKNNRTNTARMLYIIIGALLGASLVGGAYYLASAVDQKTPQQNPDRIFPTITPTPQKTQGLANPASVYCGQQGGTTVMQTNGSGGQYGLCDFGSGMACEEWAMYRGECPIGGIKTTGYDTIQQKYCAWSGGTTLAVQNATCTFKNGTTCSVDAFYNGSCSTN
jgi:putative hemolysin